MPAEKEKLMEKYGWDGESFASLHARIIDQQNRKIGERVLAQDKRRFKANIERIRPKTEAGKKLEFPNIDNIIRRSAAIIKAREKGKLLRESLRGRLRKDLKDALLEEGIATTRGTVPQAAIRNFKRRIKKTFDSYTKRDPETGIPKNLETVARTEVNGYVQRLQSRYAEEAEKKIDGFEIEETWQHRPGMSKTKPRENHAAMNRKRKRLKEKFSLIGADGKTYEVSGPHDAALPIGERANCNCNVQRRFVKSG
jgi:hypothetical protein